MRKTPSRRLVELKTGRSLEDVLRELYVERGYSFVEIGKALEVSRETVRLWVDEFGLVRPSAEEAIA